MEQVSAALAQLGVLCALAALADLFVEGARLKSGVRLISGLLAVESIFALMRSLFAAFGQGVGWTP